VSPFTENNTYQNVNAFHKQPVLNHAPRNVDDEKRALTYLDKHAPDLIGMVMGHVL
jgi:hypothetical protein